MSAKDQYHTPGKRRPRCYPNLMLRTMRGGLADPAEIPEDPGAEAQYADIARWLRTLLECDEIRISARTDETGRPRVTAWMPQSAARRLAELTGNDAVARLLAGDADGARESMQYADDLRTLMTLGHQADTVPPPPGHERRN